MDFSWHKEEIALFDRLVQFGREELNEDLLVRDREGVFNLQGWQRCGAEGIQGLPVPRQYGGSGQNLLTAAFALEGLGQGSRDNGLNLAIGAHLWGCAMPILAFGTDEQKEQFLPRLCSGDWLGALAASEPEAGSDIGSVQTTAEKEGDSYRLNGHKIYVTNGPLANLILVLAVTNPHVTSFNLTIFLVEKDRPGLTVTPAVEKMGLRTAVMGEVHLDDCRVPLANRLGREGSGLALFAQTMEWERGLIMAPAVGAMERLLLQCMAYTRQRHQFGQPIDRFQLVASKLVDMRLRLETARMMLYKTAWRKAQGHSIMMEAAMTKLTISEAWVQSCQDALRLHAGYGYLTDNEIERELRDALGSQFYSGTAEIQRQIIANLMNTP